MWREIRARCVGAAYGVLLGEATESSLANTEETPRSPGTCPLLLSAKPPVVGACDTRTRLRGTGTCPKPHCRTWLYALLGPGPPGPTGMSRATQGAQGWLFPDEDFALPTGALGAPPSAVVSGPLLVCPRSPHKVAHLLCHPSFLL